MTESAAKNPPDSPNPAGSAPVAPAPAAGSDLSPNAAHKPRRVQVGVSYPNPSYPAPPRPAFAPSGPGRQGAPPTQGPGSGQGPGQARPKSAREIENDLDKEMDLALDALGRSVPLKANEKPLKRQWDDDLEEELQAAFEGFDPSAFETASRGRKPFELPSSQDQAAETVSAGDASSERGRSAIPEGRGPRLAKVIRARGDHVFVDLGGKSEGLIPLEHFRQLGKDVPEPGDLLEVIVQRHDSDEGITHVALKGAAVEATWENLRKGAVVEVRVTKANKGGLDVEVGGIRGFLPISQIDLNRVEDTAEYLNQRFRVTVTEANERARNLVVSRKDLLIQEREAQKAKTWAEIDEGQVRRGVVRSIKDFGAFVDLGGVDGLLHVADMSWGRLKDVYGFMKAGQEVEVKVLKIDRETKKINLGLKQLAKSPWDDVDENYPVGKIVKGKVVRLQDFGAFVELEPGVDGLVHISEVTRQKIRKVSDALKEDQEIEVQVLKIDRENKRISLSIRQAEEAKAKAEAVAAMAEMQAAKAAAGEASPPNADAGSSASSGAEATANAPASASAASTKEEAPKPPQPKFQGPLKGGLGQGGSNLFGVGQKSQ